MKLCDTCIYRNNVEQLKPCIIYRSDCEFYEKERGYMTREEAIENLKCLLESNYVDRFEDEENEALTMAIKALEQEPKTIQEKQAESEKYDKAFEDGYENGYAQARFDLEQEPCNTDTCKVVKAYMNEWDKPNNSDAISRQEAIRIAEQGQVQGYEWQFKELVKLPPVNTTSNVSIQITEREKYGRFN